MIYQSTLDNLAMPLSRLTLRQLEVFVQVAELRSFSVAASRLGLTVQAVSQLVAELESTVGFRLLERTTRRVEISSAGRDYLPSVQTILRHVQAAEIAADDVRHRASGLVRVGAPMVMAASILPALIHRYAKQRPKVVVRLRDVAVEELVDAVASGDVDMAVGPDRAAGADAEVTPLFDSPWVLWCSARHALARRKRIAWAELHRVPLVAAGRDHEFSVEPMRLSAPDEDRVTPVEVVDNVSTAFGIAAQGLAATLAPAYVGVMAESFGLRMVRVVEPETMRKACLYKPVGRSMSPAAEGFAEFIADELKNSSRWSLSAATAGRDGSGR